EMKYLYKSSTLYRLMALVGLVIVHTFITVSTTQAGDPDDIIGPANPNLYVCTSGHDIVSTNADAFDGEIFDPTKTVDLEALKTECNAAISSGIDATVEFLKQTRIEGIVYEYYPVDPDNPAESEWVATPSFSVPVFAKGVSFEIFWGSDKDGNYYFDHLGAGPIVLNLKLPEDAHAINPNIVVESNGFNQVWNVPLGFYRGDVGPADVLALQVPTGGGLPIGSTRYNAVVGPNNLASMPDAGGILPQDQPIYVIVLAAMVLVVLPVAGIYSVRKKSAEDQN
ncbi:MAG: hypothetical protein AAF485_28405, partial [Chloroflexota bacterium]